MVMSSRALRVGVAEAKARFAELVAGVDQRRTIIQRRGKDVAVVIGIEELARLEEAGRGATAGLRLLARLDEVKAVAGVALDFEPERIAYPLRDPFAAPARKRRT
jgi:prevent-host-death family protein